MTIGTNGNDSLAAVADFDLVSALGGNDLLFSSFNGTHMLGGMGDDTLTTNHTVDGALVVQTQIGGTGADQMSLQIGGTHSASDLQIVGVADGGFGNDDILGQFDGGGTNVTTSGHVSGGIGSDTLRLAVGANTIGTGTTSGVLDAGNGNDTVNTASSFAAGITSASGTMSINLGNGTDTLNTGFSTTFSNGTSTQSTVIDGGNGTDTIDFESRFQSFSDGGGGTATGSLEILGGNGQDTITSSVLSNNDTLMLDELASVSELHGDNGSDEINSIADVDVVSNISTNDTITSGVGDDLVTMNHDFEAQSDTSNVSAYATVDLGTGNDTLSADLDVNGGDSGFLVTTVDSAGGFNDVTLNSRVLTDSFALSANTITTGDNADVLDMDSSAFLVSTGATQAGNIADARNTARTGGGDDIVDMVVQSQSSGDGASASAVGFGAYALNDVQTAAGNDEITAGTFVFSDSTGGNGQAQINVDAGTGNDMIDSTISSDFSALDEVQVTSVLIAGTGADTVTSDIDAFATDDINVFNQIDGGGGADVISSTIVVESFGAATSIDVAETISGGSSADMITSVFDSTQTPDLTGTADFEIFGGTGNDTIMATASGDLYEYRISGEGGNDVITLASDGGTGNFQALDGGDGQDTLTGGATKDDVFGGAGSDRIIASQGDDYLIGGDGSGGDSTADTFVFDPTSGYLSSIRDFESGFDILEFTGLVDTGVAGLANDIDALGSWVDFGSGFDVRLNLTAGGFVEFAGLGTGSVGSIADLVVDINAQLIA